MGMLPLLIAGIAALAIVVIAVGIAMSAGGGGVSSRLERYASGKDPDADAEDGDSESAVVAGLSRVIDQQDFTARLATDLARADLKMKPAEFLIFWAITPIGFVFVAFIVGFIFPGFRNPVALVVAFVLGLYAPRFYINRRKNGRLKAFANQLPDTITLLANSLRAGSSFLQGMELVTREARPPISEEFERVVREMQLGLALQPALNNLNRRVASEDLDLMVTAIQIQAQVGGNLATVLDQIAHTIRERIRIIGEINTLTAMQRYSGYVITLLPIGLAGLLFLISPTLHDRHDREAAGDVRPPDGRDLLHWSVSSAWESATSSSAASSISRCNADANRSHHPHRHRRRRRRAPDHVRRGRTTERGRSPGTALPARRPAEVAGRDGDAAAVLRAGDASDDPAAGASRPPPGRRDDRPDRREAREGRVPRRPARRGLGRREGSRPHRLRHPRVRASAWP